MLRKLLFVSLAVITLASCKKDKNNDAPAYNMSAKIDGVVTTFNTAVVAQKFGDAQTGYILTVSAFGGSIATPYPAFGIGITSDVPVTAKSYVATTDDVSGTYTSSATFEFDSDTNFTVNISSLTATEVRGTFSGVIEDGTGATKTVTDGTFTAKFQ